MPKEHSATGRGHHSLSTKQTHANHSEDEPPQYVTGVGTKYVEEPENRGGMTPRRHAPWMGFEGCQPSEQ